MVHNRLDRRALIVLIALLELGAQTDRPLQISASELSKRARLSTKDLFFGLGQLLWAECLSYAVDDETFQTITVSLKCQNESDSADSLSAPMQSVLALGRKGAELVSLETGKDVHAIPYFTPARFKRSLFTLEHELAISQIGLCLEILTKMNDNFKLLLWETAPQRVGTSVRVLTPKGLDHIPLVADAFFGVSLEKESSWFLLELDRGTIDLVRMRRKFAGYVSWWKNGGPQARFGLKNLRLLVVAPNEARVQKLLQAAREVTEKGGSGFFWMSTQELADLQDPTRFLQSIWRKPNDTNQLYSLFETPCPGAPVKTKD